jgi:diadenosine tetraphosphate (Ap4A) HIT family hydrolase
MNTKKCLFCRIASGEEKSYIIMENKTHLAFLDAFPLVNGQTIVIPKKHFSGYAFDMPADDLKKLMAFTQRVAKRIDSALGAERCMQVFQGYAIDHVHTKLFPVKQVKERVVNEETYRTLIGLLKPNWYSGFIISMSGKERESDEKLKRLADKIIGRT